MRLGTSPALSQAPDREWGHSFASIALDLRRLRLGRGSGKSPRRSAMDRSGVVITRIPQVLSIAMLEQRFAP
jgi:hypothetical protein